MVLLDVDGLKRALDDANAIVETARQPLVILDGDLRIERANRAFYETLALSAEETEGRLLHDIGDGQWVSSELLRRLHQVLPQQEARLDEFMVEHPGRASMLGDPDRVQQVAWNLLSNAVKLTPRGGRVTVAVRAVDSHVELRVSDTGKGIPSSFLPHVFERFRQAEGRASRTEHGLGLGLAIVRNLVEMQGGTVRAESPGEGQGATFTVGFPVPALLVEDTAEDAT